LTYKNLLLVDEQNLVNIVDSTFNWMINVDTSLHVILRRDIFCSYTSDKFDNVKLAHECSLKCVGFGEVNLELSNDTKLTLEDVKQCLRYPAEFIFSGHILYMKVSFLQR
jgi:hypothetical protein